MDPESDYIMLDVYMVLHELCHVQPPKVGLFISAVEQVKFYLFFFLDFFFFLFLSNLQLAEVIIRVSIVLQATVAFTFVNFFFISLLIVQAPLSDNSCQVR